jgi:hypothetical protein
MKKSEFDEIERKYFERRKYLENVKPGNLVWEEVGRCFDNDYHPAVVKSVNVDEDYIDVIDVSESNNPEKRYIVFLTESELLKEGFTEETIKEDHKKYEGIIKMVTQN